MAAHVETSIKEALFSRLSTLVTTPALPVAYPNVSFDKPDGAYLEAKVFPNRTRQATLGTTGLNRHIGFLQVNVVWPRNQGDPAPSEVAGAIVAHFKRGTDLSRDGIIVTVDEPPYVMAGFNDEDNASRYTLPVTVPYRSDTPNP